MALTFPRVFSNLTTALMSYLDDNFNYIKNLFGQPNGFATLTAAGKVNERPYYMPTFRGALAFISVDTSVSNNAAVAITFDSIANGYDTDSIRSGNQFVVPAGVNKVRLIGSGEFDTNATGNRRLTWWKNGLTVMPGNVSQNAVNGDTTKMQAITPVIPVVPGDYFILWAFQNSGGALLLKAANLVSYAGMEIVE